MWHEARKQEKKLRCMIVDYRKRAERRREFYEKFKADPTQFMQVHGRPCKIYLEPHIAASAENCMMPWQGNADNMIDRFDVRAHLDVIPEWQGGNNPGGKSQAMEEEEQNPGINYERYRILIQSDLSGTSEDKFLHQIHLEEQFGNSATSHSHLFGGKNLQPKAPKAAIGYNYEDSTPAFSIGVVQQQPPHHQKGGGGAPQVPPGEDEESEEEIDFDLLVNVDELTHGQKAELNNFGVKYGLGGGDFMEFLNGDLEEKEKLRLAKLHEEEKQAMSGRKARRERRAYKDKLILRKGYISPPSYATYACPPSPGAGEDLEGSKSTRRSSSRSESRSRSNSPEKITFITSFGGNEESDEGVGGRNIRPLPFEPTSRAGGGGGGTSTVFGPTLPPERKGGDGVNKRSRFVSRRSRSLEFLGRSTSTSNRRRGGNRSRSNSRRRRSRSGRRCSSSRRRRSRRRRGERSSSSGSRSPRGRRSRRRSSSSRSRSRDRRRKRRRSSRDSRSRSRSRSRRRSRSRSKSRSRSRGRYRRRSTRSRSRSRNRRRGSRSRSRDRRRRRKGRSSSSSSSASSSTSTTSRSSPAKSRRRSKSSSVSPFRRLSRRSKSRERPSIPSSGLAAQPSSTKEGENGSSSGLVVTGSSILPTEAVPVPLMMIKEPSPPPPPVRRYYGRAKRETRGSSSEDSSDLSEDSDDEEDNSGKGGGRLNGSQSSGASGSVLSRRDSDLAAKGKSGLLISSMISSASKEEPLHHHLPSGSSSGSSSLAKLTPKERLRRKMQSALSKTFKADKEAEKQRQEKQVQERLEREESLRELTIKYRRREREKRHRDKEYGGRSSDDSDRSSGRSRSGSRSRSPSSSRSPPPRSTSSGQGRRSRVSCSRSNSPSYY